MTEVSWKAKALKQLKKLKDVSAQKRIVRAAAKLNFFPATANVKALTNHEHEFRLRVGNYRVFFNAHESIQVISIEEVKKRDEHTY